MSVEQKHHPEEWFFLHNFDIDKVFSTIQRADYLILYYIKMQAEQHPDSKVYLADLAAVMGLKVTELSKAVEKLQDKALWHGRPTVKRAAPMWSFPARLWS